jgi:hypothetical protein
MPWRPLITGDQVATIHAVIREVVAAVEEVPATQIGDLVDRAVLHAYAGRAEIAPAAEDRGAASLAAAVAALARSLSRPGLYGGAAGVGWCVCHLASGDTADLVCQRVDAVLLRLLADWRDDYDLTRGLVGLGVYAVARGEAGHALARRILDELVRTARPCGAGLAWHTPPERMAPEQRPNAPDGTWNMGLAHGVPGVIALLARYLHAGVDPVRTRQLLDGAVSFLLTAEPPRDDGRFPSWHAGGPDGPSVPPHHPSRARLAWCYNDLGVAVALLSAAIVTGEPRWRADALALAHASAGRSIQEALFDDTAICHGALGAAHLFNRLGHATGDDAFFTAARRFLDHGLAMRSDQPIAGFPAAASRDPVRWLADASLLSGATGVALVLHSMITDVEPAWDQLLLADLPIAES